MISETKAQRLIKEVVCRIIPSGKEKSIKAIISSLMEVINDESIASQIREFSKAFKGRSEKDQYRKLKALHKFVRSNIRYKADPLGGQLIKEPACAWKGRTDGTDCKSLTTFIYFVCYNLGIPCYIDFLLYTDNRGHVYPTALLGGKEVVIDATLPKFDVSDEGNHVQEKIRKMPKAFNRLSRKSTAAIAGCGGSCGVKKSIKKLSFPKRQNIPFSKLSEGEAGLLLQARNLELRSVVSRANGDQKKSTTQKRVANFLKNVQARGLHRSINKIYSGGDEAGLVNQVIAQLNTLQYGSLHNNLIGANIAAPWDVTGEQHLKCREAASFKALAERAGQPFNIAIYNGLVTKYTNECLDGKASENIVNYHLEDAGTVFLYEIMPPDNYNLAISDKRNKQSFWLAEVANVTGLSYENVKLIAENGTIKNLNDTPQGLHEKLRLYMVNGGASIGEPLTVTAAIALVTAIFGLIKGGLTLAQQFKKLIQNKKAEAFFSVPPLDGIAMAKADFNGNGVADSEETAIQSLFTPQNMALAFAAFFALKD